MKSFISHFYFIFAGISTNLIGNGRSKESSWSKNHCEDFQTGFIFYNMNTNQLKNLFSSDSVSKERKNILITGKVKKRKMQETIFILITFQKTSLILL